MLRTNQMLRCDVCHTRPETRWSPCWSRRRRSRFHLQPITASVERWKCSELCTETLSGLSSAPWRMSTNSLFQRYQCLPVTTTAHTTGIKSNVYKCKILGHITHRYLDLASHFYPLCRYGVTSFFTFSWPLRADVLFVPVQPHGGDPQVLF